MRPQTSLADSSVVSAAPSECIWICLSCMNYSVLSGDIRQSDLPLIMYFFRNIYWLPLWHQFLVKSLSKQGTLWPLNSGVIGNERKSARWQRSASAAKLTLYLARAHTHADTHAHSVFRSSEIEKSKTTIFINYSAVITVLIEFFTTPHPFASFIFSFLSISISLPLLCGIDFLQFSSSWPWEASGPD